MSRKDLKYGAALILFFVLAGHLFAQSDLQAELDAKKAAKAALEAELEQDRAKLNDISAQKNTLDKAVKELDATTKKLGTEVKLTENKIGQTSTTINYLENNISDRQRKIETFKNTIGAGLRAVHEGDQRPFILQVLDSEGFTAALAEADNRLTLNKNLRSAIIDLDEERKSLETDREEHEKKKEELVNYKDEVSSQKTAVDKTKNEKSSLLNQTKAEESEYQKIINEKLKLQAQFEAELADIESKLQFNLDPNSYPKAKHGILAWPTENVLITQGFGLTESSYNLYQYRTGPWKGKHAGVDFRANSDKVLAMGDGVVVGTGNTDLVCPHASMGIWILVQYDNGLDSTFMHLSQVLVKTGQRVKTGDVIAYSGNTGYSTAPHLHVGVMPAGVVSIQTWPSAGCPGKNYTTPLVANSFYLNPLDYLPKASDSMFKYGTTSE